MKLETGAQSPKTLGKSSRGDAADAATRQVKSKVIITPKRGWAALNLGEIWLYRELLYFLAWRDLQVRYKQTVIGAGWAILQPFLAMIVFSIIFGRLVGVSSDGVPYPVFVFAGLVPWTFFATAVSHSGTSLVSNSNLISKVYFPRLVLPMAAVVLAAADLFFAFLILLGLMLWYGVTPTTAVVTLPLFVMLAVLTALGVGVWLSALDVKYRDIRYLIPFLTQFWLFVTPVVYPSSYIPPEWRLVYALNPMVGVVEGFRWALLGQEFHLGGMVFVSAGVSIFLLVSGLYYFKRMERQFADVV